MKIIKIPAKRCSYGSKRNKKYIRYIVIHYTGNKGDTARGNGNYFASSNTRSAGAHFFVDRSGNIVKSVAMNRTAWSVGGFFTQRNGAGKYYKDCINSNSVSIELCDIADKYPSTKQIRAVKWLIRYIRKHCPNAKKIIRHWDVNGKDCPAAMTGTDNKNWKRFKRQITD